MNSGHPASGSRAAQAALLLVAGLAALFLLSQQLQRCDDAYITFRHARNLAGHLRPAWNLQGPPVLGSTSPALTFLLGGLGLVLGTERVDALALPLNASLLAIIVVLTWLVAHDLTDSAPWALALAVLVGFNSVNVFVFSLGFEAALLIAVLLGGLWLVRRGRDVPAVVLASLAPLVRPEGLLLTPLVWGCLLLGGRFRKPLVPAFLALPLVWAVFASSYYGSPVPQPIRSRQMRPAIFFPYDGSRVDLVARLPSLPLELVHFWTEEARPYLLSGLRSASYRPSGEAPLAFLVLLGLPAAAVWAWRRRDGRVVYLLYAPLFLVLYAWIGYREAWYMPSFVSFALVLLWQGAFVAARALRACLSAKRATGPAGRGLEALGAGLAFAALFSANNYAWNGGRYPYKGPLLALDPRGPLFEWAEIERFRTYRGAARRLNESQAEPAPVLASEVGVFGFFYRGDVIDTVGLCSPEALQFYPPPRSDIWRPDGRRTTRSNNLTPTPMVMRLQPPYVLNAQPYVRNLLQNGSPFLSAYVRVAAVGTAWGAPLLIFRRADLPAAPAPQ